MVATPVSAVISDKLGRRKCMFVGAWVIIIGSVVIASGMTLAQFVVGRFILGVGIQIMVVSAPAYAVEIAPPHWRGRAVGKSSSIEFFNTCGSGLTEGRILQLRLVWRCHSRCGYYLRHEPNQLELPVAHSFHLSVLCMYLCHLLRVVHPRVSPMAHRSRKRGRGRSLPY